MKVPAANFMRLHPGPVRFGTRHNAGQPPPSSTLLMSGLVIVSIHTQVIEAAMTYFNSVFTRTDINRALISTWI